MKSKVPPFIWVLLAVLGVVIVYRFALAPATNSLAHHPEPQPAVTADAVQDATRYAEVPQIAEIYAMAKQIPQVLDGLYCHCDCSKHSGHRSLLTCFESDHGAGCDVCLEEAVLAYRMHSEGRSLDEIRTAIDARFAS